jgi:hypothetical protein
MNPSLILFDCPVPKIILLFGTRIGKWSMTARLEKTCIVDPLPMGKLPFKSFCKDTTNS